MIKQLGILSAVIMPFFNIPLIARVIQHKSSHNISLVWVIGVWVCVVGMLPSSLQSADRVLKYFGIVNFIFFSVVFVVVLYYHRTNVRSHS